MPQNTWTQGMKTRWATAGKRWRTAVVVGVAGATIATGALVFNSDKNDYAPIDNSAGNAQTNWDYNQFANLDETGIRGIASGVYEGWHSNDVTCPFPTGGPCPGSGGSQRPDNGPGPGGQGQFRLNCDVSHFAHDDPIVKPGAPGEAHLHMFWGNTETSADTVFNGYPGNANDPHDIMNNGGGTCQANAMNRSAYWMPAMYSGPEGPGRKIIRPSNILLYYKSHRPWEVQPLPPGVQLLAGNVNPGGSVNSSFSPSGALKWECFTPGSGIGYNTSSTIPTGCSGGDNIRMVLQFPQCLATDNGQITGNPTLTSTDLLSHTLMVNAQSQCPSSHPYRVPQISYLIEFPADGTEGDWRLSSDDGWKTANPPNPGGSLHGDWLGGWSPPAIQSWIDGCFDPDTANFTNQGVNNFGGPRNCSIGQTGTNQHWFNTGGDVNGTQGTGEARSFIRISNLNNVTVPGPVADPCPNCTPIKE